LQGRRVRQRVPSPMRTRCPGASSPVEPECDAEGGLLTSTIPLAAGDGGWPPRVALTRSSCVRQSNAYAGLVESVEAVPRTLPMSPMVKRAKNSLGANVFRSSSNNGPWDSGTDCHSACNFRPRSGVNKYWTPIRGVWPLTAAPPLDLKGQFKFEFNNYLRSALTLRRVSSVREKIETRVHPGRRF
jgi:hypothetical protein